MANRPVFGIGFFTMSYISFAPCVCVDVSIIAEIGVVVNQHPGKDLVDKRVIGTGPKCILLAVLR